MSYSNSILISLTVKTAIKASESNG